MRQALLLLWCFFQVAALAAQTNNVSGYWKNEAGTGANWVQLRHDVWFISITNHWKEFFEGKIQDSGKIEGRLVKINLQTWERFEVRMEMELTSKEKIMIPNPLPEDSSYTSSGALHYAGYYAFYENIPRPIFDDLHRLWEVKTWFQDGDTIAAAFISMGEPLFDKGVFINKDSLQIIRHLKWSAHPCYTQEVLHCKLEKDGLIHIKARNIEGTCSASTDHAWGGATRIRYVPDGGFPPGDGRIDPREVAIPADILQLKLRKFLVNGQPVYFDPATTPEEPFPVNEQQEIVFQFSTAVAGIKLYYQLKGYDADWHLGFPENQARYAHLPEGNYTFLVTSDPEWLATGGNTLEFPLRVFRPFYRQSWFYLALVLVFALLIAWGFRWRELQRRGLEQLRQRIARELHDDIGSTISSISMLTAAAKTRIRESSVNHQLDSIGKKAREALDNIGDILWTMRNEEISNEDLLQRMRAFAVEILEARGADVHFQTTGTAPDLQLTAEQRKELYLLFKEAVNNAAKYSDASEVHISLHFQNDSLQLQIHDHGRGFDPASTKRGNGLDNMQRRAARLGGKLRIESAPGAGTRIVLEV